jgi:hypothetical protein
MWLDIAKAVLWCLIPPFVVGVPIGLAYRLGMKRGDGPADRWIPRWLGPLVALVMNVCSLSVLVCYVCQLVPKESRTGTYGAACGLIAGWMLVCAMNSARRLGIELFSGGLTSSSSTATGSDEAQP